MEMRNEFDSRFLFWVAQMRNEKLLLYLFPIRILPLANWINGIPLDFFPIFNFPFLIGKTHNGKWKWVEFSFLIYRNRNGKWEIGQFPISYFELRKWEMGNGLLYPFPISHSSIGNRINVYPLIPSRQAAGIRDAMLPPTDEHKMQDMRRNEDIRKEMGREVTVVDLIKHRKLQLFGHICRMDDTRLLKTLTFGIVEGTRPPGRPPRRWTDDITEWTGMDLEQALRSAQDRDKWRTMTSPTVARPRAWTGNWPSRHNGS